MDLVQGTLDMLVLKALQWGPRHGYAVSRWIGRTTGEVLRVEEGALYPALHRLHRKGLVEAEWGVSENNRRARFYELTRKGRRALAKETEGWATYAAAVGRVLAADGPAAKDLGPADAGLASGGRKASGLGTADAGAHPGAQSGRSPADAGPASGRRKVGGLGLADADADSGHRSGLGPADADAGSAQPGGGDRRAGAAGASFGEPEAVGSGADAGASSDEPEGGGGSDR